MLSISYCAIYFHFLDQIQGINILGRFSSPSLHKPFCFTFTIFIKTICLNQINFAVTESRNWNAVSKLSVRVKGGMSLRNGMWHGLRNDIIMRNVKYGNWRKEIN